MRFSRLNVATSLQTHLAAFFLSRGYDVHWHATGETEAQTAGLAVAKATVTFTPSFPANPQHIVRLKSDSGGREEVVVPVLALRMEGSPVRTGLLGLGHRDADWEWEFLIDCFALDEFQQEDLASLLTDWLLDEHEKVFEIFDYDTNPDLPTAVGPLRVVTGGVDPAILPIPQESARYHILASAIVTFIE